MNFLIGLVQACLLGSSIKDGCTNRNQTCFTCGWGKATQSILQRFNNRATVAVACPNHGRFSQISPQPWKFHSAPFLGDAGHSYMFISPHVFQSYSLLSLIKFHPKYCSLPLCSHYPTSRTQMSSTFLRKVVFSSASPIPETVLYLSSKGSHSS